MKLIIAFPFKVAIFSAITVLLLLIGFIYNVFSCIQNSIFTLKSSLFELDFVELNVLNRLLRKC